MKQVLLTGWMSGLWKEMAHIAIKKWYKVDILDISDGWIKDLHKDMKYIKCDISKIETTLLKKLSARYDIIICNAGISLSWNFIEHNAEANNRLMHINTLGHIELVRLLWAEKRIHSKGGIWFIASASEMLPFPIALWYAATKWALRAFGVSLRSYLIGQKISVSIVYPGPMPTAHVKYYGKEISHDEKALKKVQKIARKTFNWIEKWKRNIYPDAASKIIKVISPFGWVLDRIMYRAYKKDIS